MKIILQKTRAIDLQENDVCYCNAEFGTVIKKGKTWLHNHQFVVIEWKNRYDIYDVRYYAENNKYVMKLIVKEAK